MTDPNLEETPEGEQFISYVASLFEAGFHTPEMDAFLTTMVAYGEVSDLKQAEMTHALAGVTAAAIWGECLRCAEGDADVAADLWSSAMTCLMDLGRQHQQMGRTVLHRMN